MREVKQPTITASPTAFKRLADWCDRVMLTLSPTMGAQRLAARRQLEVADLQYAQLRRNIENRYDGAEKEVRGDKWLASRLSPDSEIEPDLEDLRARSRDLAKNDSIGGAIDCRTANVIGTGLKPCPQVKELEGVVTADEAKAFNLAALRLYHRWYPKADVNRKDSLWLVQDLAFRTLCTDGEAFVVMSDVGAADLPVPLALQVVASDRCETPPHKISDPRVRMGVEKDASGRIVAYWFRKSHPYDTFATSNNPEQYDRIPADRVCHVFWRWFPEQTRGLPWMVRVLNRLRDIKDLDEATIIACQVEACYVAFIKTTDPGGAMEAARRQAAGLTAGGKRYNSLEPATVRYLNPNEEVQFGQPTRPGSSYAPLQEWNHRRAAAGMNTSYEMLAKNWAGLSFAAGRLILAEQRLNWGRDQQLTAEQELCPVWNRLMAEGVVVGELPVDPRKYAASPWVFNEHEWVPNAWPYVLTPGEEIKASRDAIDGNLETLEYEATRRGYTLEQLLDQRKLEVEMQRERGILPLSTPGAADPNAPQSKEYDDQRAGAAA